MGRLGLEDVDDGGVDGGGTGLLELGGDTEGRDDAPDEAGCLEVCGAVFFCGCWG